MTELRSGGQLVVEQLLREGVDTAFCVPGESYLEVLDALHDAPIKLVVCRQEGGAGYMADAHARVTGKPGVFMVTRGPGAANAMVAIHTAWQDSVPLVLFVGLIPRAETYRESFQEFDLDGWFGSTAKAVFQIEHAERVPELVARAFAIARSGRPGPVVIGLPEDMLRDRVAVQATDSISVQPSVPAAQTMDELASLLATAARPLVVLGGGGWTPAASRQIQAWAERYQLPVTVDFNCLDLIDQRSPSYVGSLGYGRAQTLAEAMRDADLVIGIGSPLGDIVTDSWALLPVHGHPARLVTVLPDHNALGAAHPRAQRITASVVDFAAALANLQPGEQPVWAERTRALHEAGEQYRCPAPIAGNVDLNAIFSHLQASLPEDTLVTWGAGNHAGWAGRFMRFTGYPSQLAPRNGSMGYGVPAAIAAALAQPGRQVLSVAGDGCFMMNGQEIAVARGLGVAPLIVVLNNGMYGTIRTHQEIHHPHRVSGTDLVNPDFAAYARAYGGHGEVVERTEEFAGALERARASGVVSIIEIRIAQDIISPELRMSDLHQ
ncbi:acetolactate synthase-1/2/3 large subunit [Pseudomonas linyingensis]|uniref:Acetolactate synthase-1/2/3 large subunit n=1 Tax=Pseudomonas linyingensis TaxID=915471 RepID=A0A1H7A1S7_9PSED|nr:thiamine pyrophosphate-dependent enzyme [Pseudomonas linyingensis]SEJ58856.1 acetolactate synthase-1/2/3 large subunit [Pseudomonas linyingensis]